MNYNSYDNPFGKEPKYEFYDNLIESDAKKAMSRTHLGLFFLLLAANAFIYAVLIVLALVLNDGQYDTLVSNPYFNTLIGTLPLYTVGLPIFYLIVKDMPKHRFSNTGMGVGEFLKIIPVSFALMMLGNYIGVAFNEFFAIFKGADIENSTIGALTSAPAWLTFILAVVVGPIAEEFIFRKLLMDRIAPYGVTFSIVISALCFGLFHGNFYQFFYATLLGFVLGYVYAKSGNWLYSAGMHMVLNFIGGFLPILLEDYITRYAEIALDLLNVQAAGGDTNAYITALPAGDMAAVTVSTFYAIFQYALVIMGVIFLVKAVRRRQIRVDNSCCVKIPAGRTRYVVFGNVGSILFIAFCVFSFIGSILI